MNDNVLKKEFSKKDVQRARNLITGDTNSRTSQGIGYTKKYEHHKEGDIWEEDGRKWTIKNGIRQNVTKMDKFKKMGKIPLFCPECNTLMKNHLDKKVYPAYQKCFNCVVDYEEELRKQGKSKEYFDKLHNNNIDKVLDKYKSFVKDQLKESNDNFVTEAGDVENWKGGFNKEEVAKNLQEGLEFLEGLKIK
jgi:DNA-directed RNA polymerase subunit M/transcription elongation factor TFIIS